MSSNIFFDFSKLCKTSGWNNNCGVNCLTHFLLSKLESGELINKFNTDKEYNALLQSFQAYYGLSRKPTWDELRTLMAQYPAPTDREGIVGPVLRKHLEKILVNKAQVLWDMIGSISLTRYLYTNEAEDIAGPVVLANKTMFDKLKTKFEQELDQEKNRPFSDYEIDDALRQLLENPNIELSEKKIEEQIQFQRKNDLLDKFQQETKAYWLKDGCRRYAACIGNIINSEMISADQLALLGNALQIRVEVYTPNARMLPEKNTSTVWTLKIYNGGAHWVFEEPSKRLDKANAHNLHYPNSFYNSFYKNEKLSGKFKLYGNQDPTLSERIIQQFRGGYESLIRQQQAQTKDPQAKLMKDLIEMLIQELSKIAQIKAKQEKAKARAQKEDPQAKLMKDLKEMLTQELTKISQIKAPNKKHKLKMKSP